MGKWSGIPDGDGALPTTTEAREKACGVLMELYEKYRSNGSTFTFDYQTLQGGTALQTGAMKVVFPVRGLTAVFLLLWGWRQLSWRARMQSAGFMRRSGAGSGGCCRRRRSRHLSFSIHFGLCGASGVGKWGRAALEAGKLLFI